MELQLELQIGDVSLALSKPVDDPLDRGEGCVLVDRRLTDRLFPLFDHQICSFNYKV